MSAQIPPEITLDGDHVTLFRLGAEHFDEVFAAIGHPLVFAGGYGGGPAGLRDDPAAFGEWLAGYLPFTTGVPWGVRLRGGPHDGLIVGTSSLGEIDTRNEGLHLGWTAYDPRVWGTAVNAETKLLLLGAAFDNGFGRVKLQADAINARSRAAIERLGAVPEGIQRHTHRRADGSWRDSAVYSILAEEWPEVRSGLRGRLDSVSGRPVLFRSVAEG